MKVAIVDDNEIDRFNLTTLLENRGEIEVVGEAATVEDAVALIDRKKPDAVFLDIHLGRQRGFTVLEQARHRPQVVITTLHPQYALQGFEIAAADYLVKPVTEATLARAVARLLGTGRSGAPDAGPQLELDDILSFKQGSDLCLLPVRQIQAILGERDSTRVLGKDGRKFLHDRPLREWRELLPETTFAPLDRSTIMNLREILNIQMNADGSGQITFRGSAHTAAIGITAMNNLRRFLK